jgi:hypothetical protein
VASASGTTKHQVRFFAKTGNLGHQVKYFIWLACCNTPSTLGPTVLTPSSSLESYIVPTDQHESFVHTLSSLMCTRENFPVGHSSQIAPSQARLTWRSFRDRLSKKKMHIVDMSTLSILLSLGPGYHHPWARISHLS